MISLRTGLEAGVALAIIIAIPIVDHRAYNRGKNDEVAAQSLRNALAATKAREKTDKASDASSKVGVTVEAATVKERVVTQTLIREVPRYVTVVSDAKCVVPAGFVRLHDQAATGLLPQASDAPGEPFDAPSGVALSAVGSTVVANYGSCREDAERLRGWQAWYAGVAPIFAEK